MLSQSIFCDLFLQTVECVLDLMLELICVLGELCILGSQRIEINILISSTPAHLKYI